MGHHNYGLDDAADVALLLACLLWVYWQPFGESHLMWRKRINWYYDFVGKWNQNEFRHGDAFSFLLFPAHHWMAIIWGIAMSAAAIAYFLYFEDDTDVSTKYYIPQAGLFIGGFLAAKLWPTVFFDFRKLGLALFLALCAMGCGVASLVLFGVQGHGQWIPFGLLMLYVLLVSWGTFMNWVIIGHHREHKYLMDDNRADEAERWFAPFDILDGASYNSL